MNSVLGMNCQLTFYFKEKVHFATAWCVLELRIEGQPPAMEGS
jgi:hypothetical protein